MTSTTSIQHAVTAPRITFPQWSPMARLRRAAMTTSYVVGSAVSATRSYEGAQGPTARRAVLTQFADDLR